MPSRKQMSAGIVLLIGALLVLAGEATGWNFCEAAQALTGEPWCVSQPEAIPEGAEQ